MQVIEVLADAGTEVSLAALSERLAFPKTSVMHLLRALEAATYVRRSSAGYRLGAASYRMGMKIDAIDNFDESSQQVMEELLAATLETVLLGAFTADRSAGVYTMRYPSPQAVRFAPDAGELRPLYATGMGKLLLAFAPDAFVDDYLSHVRLQKFTAKTVTAKAALRRQLRNVRASGLAVSVDEMADGGSALAAPVYERDGQVLTALVIALPTFRLLTRRAVLETAIRATAAKLSELKGHLPHS